MKLSPLLRCGLLLLLAGLSLSLTARAAEPATNSAAADAQKIRIACVGDSITEGSGYPAALQKMLGSAYEVQNFGVSGSTLLSKGDKPYIKQPKWIAAHEFKPHAILLMLGTNDTKPQNYKFAGEAASNLRAMVDDFAKLDSKPKIFLMLPVPVIGEGNFGINNKGLEDRILPAIKKVAAERKLTLIDLNAALRGRDELFKDRVHPQGAQELMAAPAKEALLKALPAPAAAQ